MEVLPTETVIYTDTRLIYTSKQMKKCQLSLINKDIIFQNRDYFILKLKLTIKLYQAIL
jgi:hypothetical protein